jgi:GWxTD domain-containing protein
MPPRSMAMDMRAQRHPVSRSRAVHHAAVIALAWCSGAQAVHAASAPDSASASVPGIGSTLQPGAASGDFDFQTDVASVRPTGAGGSVVRVLVQLPVRDFLAQTRAERADLRLRLRVFAAERAFAALAEEGREAAPSDRASQRAGAEGADVALERMMHDFESVERQAEAERGARIEGRIGDLLDTDFRLFDLSVELAPGDYVFEVLGENLSRRKPGLLDRLRNRPLAAVARQLVRVPDLTRLPALADPTFHIGAARSDYAARLYGLLNDSLHVRSTLFGTGTFAVHVTATDRAGEVHWRDSLRVDVADRRELEWSTSVNTFPAGQYVLQWMAAGAGGGATVTRSFDVAWALATWTRPRRDHDTEAELVLHDNEFETYRALPLGERERFLERFWMAHDPSPDTAVNEVLEEFQRRVAYADLNFPETRRGALSDRGRVFVHFGVPDEVQIEAVPSHLAGRGAEEALEKVDDAYVASEHRRNEDPDQMGSTRGTSAWDRSLRTQEHSRVIGPANEVVSYELWLYRGGGTPLLPEDKGVAIDAGLRVLFVDTGGYGRYRLRKSSARLDIRGVGANF